VGGTRAATSGASYKFTVTNRPVGDGDERTDESADDVGVVVPDKGKGERAPDDGPTPVPARAGLAKADGDTIFFRACTAAPPAPPGSEPG
jgi:hypothetical protein